MNRSGYSSQIVKAIRDYLRENRIDCEFYAEKGVIEFTTASRSIGLDFMVTIFVRKDMYIVYAAPLIMGKPIRIMFNIFDDAACEKGVNELNNFVNRVNNSLYIGNLEWYPNNGKIYSRCSVDCSGIAPSRYLIHRSISTAVCIWELYVQGVTLIVAGKTANDALQYCKEENAKGDTVSAYQKAQDMLAAAADSANEDAEAMHARIDNRFSRRQA